MPPKSARPGAPSSYPAGDGAASPNAAVSVRFGMPQAVVVLGFIAAAVVLRLAAHMSVRGIVPLLTAVGAIAVAVLLTTGYGHHGRRCGFLRRLLNAALTPGSGN